MRFVLWVSLIGFALVSCTRKTEYERTLDAHRNAKISSFLKPELSPLDSIELKSFKGLYFYKPDPAWTLDAQLMWYPQFVPVSLPTSDNQFKPFLKVGELHFQIQGKSYSLQVFQNEAMRTQRELFVPFSDATNSKTTYGGGRYLDISYAPNSTRCVIDFNYAYAPYCAYSKNYSCPKVPAENQIPVEIAAGERLFVQ